MGEPASPSAAGHCGGEADVDGQEDSRALQSSAFLQPLEVGCGGADAAPAAARHDSKYQPAAARRDGRYQPTAAGGTTTSCARQGGETGGRWVVLDAREGLRFQNRHQRMVLSLANTPAAGIASWATEGATRGGSASGAAEMSDGNAAGQDMGAEGEGARREASIGCVEDKVPGTVQDGGPYASRRFRLRIVQVKDPAAASCVQLACWDLYCKG